MPDYFVRLRRTIDYTGFVEADSAADAVTKFGEQVRADPNAHADSDSITGAFARHTPDSDEEGLDSI